MIEFRYKPQGETLKRFHISDKRVRMIMGPLGSAKTHACAFEIMRKACTQEPAKDGVRYSRWFVVRNTYPDLKTTTIRDWQEIYSDIGRVKMDNPPEQVWDMPLEDGTRIYTEIIFLALDQIDDVKKLRGAQATGFWFNEVKEIPKAMIDMADSRIGRYPSKDRGSPSWFGIIGDTNAPDEDHWYYALAENDKKLLLERNIEPVGDDWQFFRQPGGMIWTGEKAVVNPNAENISNLPEGYYEKQCQGKSIDWIKVNLCNEYGFVQDGKPVYPEYVDSLHCASEPLQPVNGLSITVGMDFGRTPAAVFFQSMPDGQWRAIHEVTTNDMGAERFAEIVHQVMDSKFKGYTFDIWGDPSGDSGTQNDENTVFKILNAQGIPAKPCNTQDQTLRKGGLKRAMSRLVMGGKPGFLISPTCSMLRKGLAGKYRYKRILVRGDPRYHDEPDKNEWSHVCEAAEYGLLGGGESLQMLISSRPQTPVTIKQDWSVF